METSEVGQPSDNYIGGCPGYILWQSAMRWQRKVNQTLSVFDLTYTQFIVLTITGWLQDKQQEVYQYQVARFARIDRMMTSRVIANLERKDFIKRLKKNEDARANLVYLTPEGIKVMKQALSVVEKLEESFFNEKLTCNELIIRNNQD